MVSLPLWGHTVTLKLFNGIILMYNSIVLLCSDHELLIAKFRLKLKKVRKTTRPFRYNLNQIPYDFTVEVRNRFKGHDIVQEAVIKPSPRKINAKRQNGFLMSPYKELRKEEK